MILEHTITVLPNILSLADSVKIGRPPLSVLRDTETLVRHLHIGQRLRMRKGGFGNLSLTLLLLASETTQCVQDPVEFTQATHRSQKTSAFARSRVAPARKFVSIISTE